jgi:hypothetical protein
MNPLFEIAPYLHLRASKLYNARPAADRLAGAIAGMDMEAVASLLQDGRFYNNVAKSEFLTQLSEVFNAFRSSSDERLNVFKGRRSADLSMHGFRFVGNHSGHFYDLVIHGEEPQGLEVYACDDLLFPIHFTGLNISAFKNDSPF